MKSHRESLSYLTVIFILGSLLFYKLIKLYLGLALCKISEEYFADSSL